MKKIIILGAMALMVAVKSLALDAKDYKVLCKLNNNNTLTALSKYLNTDNEQNEKLKYIFELTDNDIKIALKKSDMIAADKALWFNLGNAKYILTDEQYKKYLTAINLTIYSNSDTFLAEN